MEVVMKHLVLLLLLLLPVAGWGAEWPEPGEMLSDTENSTVHVSTSSIRGTYFWDFSGFRYKVVMDKGCRSASAFVADEEHPVAVKWHKNNEIQFGNRIAEDGDGLWLAYHATAYNFCEIMSQD
jgi:hypothetical protein